MKYTNKSVKRAFFSLIQLISRRRLAIWKLFQERDYYPEKGCNLLSVQEYGIKCLFTVLFFILYHSTFLITVLYFFWYTFYTQIPVVHVATV